jgi:hypothetical protein
MADDIESQLSAVIEKAPMTLQEGDEGFSPSAIPEKAAPVQDEPTAIVEKTDAEKAAEALAAENDIEVIRKRLADIEKKAADKDGQAASERAKRRAAEAQNKQMADQLARYEQQQRALQARRQMGNIPDPEENVVEALKYERALRMQREQQEGQRWQQQQVQQQQIDQVTQLKNTVEDFEAEFRDANPDYDEAAEWLVDMEQKKLELAGAPKAQAEQMALNWAINMAQMGLSQGRNPAQMAYEAAKMLNWRPKSAGANTAAQQLAAQQQKLSTQKAGQQAAKTIGGGGAQSSGTLSLAQIGELKGAAFDSAMEKYLSR